MYAPKTRQELALILEALQDFAAVEQLVPVSEALADARLHLAMGDPAPVRGDSRSGPARP
ncbi:hypothetical protein GE300_16065 [Rhodobacteraceae bacterium 2CG4]|uniref:Uncharacterized protein n=1 Tax=Halovulum marinum TaxID=2662447 RepID=A0A6L5Z4Y7_9RHOB|nr:hypothetical protein [Halovulum marinum]MSU91104.1 hypothetical protein [Halovulum marinum]